MVAEIKKIIAREGLVLLGITAGAYIFEFISSWLHFSRIKTKIGYHLLERDYVL